MSKCLAFVSIFIVAFPLFNFGQDKIAISGCIIDDSSGVGVINTTIRIFNAESKLLLAQLHSGVNNNCFNTSLQVNSSTKLKIEVRHVSYHSSYIEVAAENAQKMTIPIKRNYTVMEEIIVPPSNWKIGDTTFHNVNAYKVGDEKTLSDLLKNIPGFTLDAQGNLYYNQKKINSILINGTGIFTNRIQTLINNFPIHRLKNIQAIENQTKNKLLQGLGPTTETQINLSLDGEKGLNFFGNIDAGGGNKDRYEAKGTSFSLLKQLKSGIITNANTMGNTYNAYLNDYIYNTQISSSNNTWASTQPNFSLIPFFEAKKYITNNERELLFETNADLSKKIKQKIEFSVLNAKQKQQFNSYEKQTAENGIFETFDTSYLKIKPTHYSLKHELSWRNANTELSLKQEYSQFSTVNNSFRNRSFNNQMTHQLDSGHIQNKAAFWNLSFIKRINNNQALSINSFYSTSKIKNDALSKNDDNDFWQKNMNTIGIRPVFNLAEGYIITEFFNKNKKNKKYMPKLIFDYNSISMGNTTYLNHYPQLNEKLLIPHLSENGKYAKYLLYQKTEFSTTYKKYNLDINYMLGLSKAVKNDNEKQIFYNPFYYLSLNLSDFKRQARFLRFDFNFSNNSPTLKNLPNIYIAQSVNNFYSGTSNFKTYPTLKLNASSIKIFKSKKTGNSNSFSANFNHSFKSLVYQTFLDRVMVFGKDSVINKSSSTFSLSFDLQQVVMPISSLLNFSLSYSHNNRYGIVLNKVNNFKTSAITGELSLKRNWKKMYYIKLLSNAELNLSHSSSQNHSSYFFKKAFSIKNTFSQKLIINKKMNFTVIADYYINNIFTPYKSKAIYLEGKGNYNITQKLNMGILFSNITNVKSYQYFVNTPLRQSFSNIPLIPRSVFITVGYNF